MINAGAWILVTAAVGLLATGLPAWLVLVGVGSAFALFGTLTGVVPAGFFDALPARLVGLLENDLLQALPLYVLMGSLLNRLPIADALFRVLVRLFGAPTAGLVLGALMAPMNGSVGASVAMLVRTVQPRLQAAGFGFERGAGLIAMAGTLGVVIPPSLVLILFGDAVMRAHTEAVNVTHASVRILNTQDVFRGALVPALLLLGLSIAVVAFTRGGRARTTRTAAPAPSLRDWIGALVIFGALVVLLGAVTLGYMYAVEAAATGGMALFVYGLVTRSLDRAALRMALRETLALTGALFALLIGATALTLVLRAFETDRWIADVLANLPGGAPATLALGLLIFGLSALVLDAFEMIFVVVPLVLPPMLMQLPDASWVAVLVLLVLQTSFLLPPFGFALLMTRNRLGAALALGQLVRAVRPFLAVQLVVLVSVIAFPRLVHLAQPAEIVTPQLTPEEIERVLRPVEPEQEPNPAR
jgi:tripartite ATP-independent transporter DctM subunit